MDLRSYGFLVARGERPTMLGCQYHSSVFPAHAAGGGTLLRVILGGTFAPEIVDEPNEALVARAVDELRIIAGLAAKPDLSAVWKHTRVLPQYELGHDRRAREAEAELSRLSGLYLLGTGLRGVGLADCIRNATTLARSWGATSS
jgi:protoporphyrinogen/coproporphyrinogen III oxidase